MDTEYFLNYCVFFYYYYYYFLAVRGAEQHGNATDGYTKEVGYLPKGGCQEKASDQENSTQSQYCISTLLYFYLLKVMIH